MGGGQFNCATTFPGTQVPGNPARYAILFTNTDSANIAYGQPQQSSQTLITSGNAMIAVGPGQSIGFALHADGKGGRQVVTSPWNFICTAGTPNVVWLELT